MAASLRLGHLNICSLRNKTKYIKGILEKYKFHVLALTETNLKDSVEFPDIKDFTFYRNDRKVRKGGGVGFYIDSDIKVIPRSDLDHEDLEMIWVQFSLPDTETVLVGCCYRTSDSKIDYLNNICRKIEMVSNEDKDIFLLGDFNIDWLKEPPEKTRIDFVFSVCGLTQIIKTPTRNKRTTLRFTSTCIDHIYTNIPLLCSKSVIAVHKKISDHKLITASVQRSVLRNTATEPSVLSELTEYLPINNIIENEDTINFERVKKEEVKRLLFPAKAYLLQTASPSISDICHILNSCIDHGEFPSESHESFISHQILQKILLLQMEKKFDNYKLFTQYKTFGDITDEWLTDLENKKQVGVVFMDFSSFSYIISLDLLLHKLKSYHFSNLAISMIRSFLSDRNSCSCLWTDTRCELPQGSCMSHFLFSIYTNDLKIALKSAHVVVSGSQLMIYHSADNYEGLKEVLKDESKAVCIWLRKNGMVLKTFTSARIRTKEPVKRIQACLNLKLSSEFNWIGIVGVLLHNAPHLVWKS